MNRRHAGVESHDDFVYEGSGHPAEGDPRQPPLGGVGTRLIVEETPEGVLLKPAPTLPPTRPEDVFGCLPYDGPPITIEEMHQAILDEAARRYARIRC